MKELNKYYHYLFQHAVKLERYHFFTELLILVLLVLSNFIEGYLLYCITLGSLIVQIISFILRRNQVSMESTGHKIQEYAMLYTAFRKDTFNFDVAQLKGAIPSYIHAKVEQSASEPESSDYVVDEKSKNALLLMIQENAFWNHHLYRAATYRAMLQLLIPVSSILLFMILLPGTTFVEPKFNLPRIAIAFLGTNILFNQIDHMIKWYKSSRDMLALDNSIERQVEKSEDFWLHTFTIYNVIKSSTPIIPESIYEKNKLKLNDAWHLRYSLK